MKKFFQLLFILFFVSHAVIAADGKLISKTKKTSTKVDEAINIKIENIPEANLKELDSKSLKQRDKYLYAAISDIRGKWKSHTHSFKKTGKFNTVISFSINNYGVISDPHVLESSNDPEYDDIALKFVQNLEQYEDFSNNVNESFYNIPIDLGFVQKKDDYGYHASQKFHYLNDDHRRYQAYMDVVSKLITSAWIPKIDKKDNDQCLKAVLDFDIERKGDSSEVKILENSKSKKFDKSLIKFVKKTDFPDIPDDIEDSHLDIKYTFQVNCNMSETATQLPIKTTGN